MANLVFQKERKTFWSFLFGTKITFSMYDDGTLTHHYHRPKFWIFKCDKFIELHAKDVQFYIPGSGFLGIPGLFNMNTAYMGGPKGQFKLKKLTKDEVKSVREHICKHESPIGESGNRYGCWNFWNPISWLRNEYLYTTPSGVRYERGKNVSFIPWEEIHFFYDYTTLFTCGWDVFICGEHFIDPKARVHGDFVKEVKDHLKDDAEDGKKLQVRPGFFWRLFHPFHSRRPIVIMTDKAVFSIDKDITTIPYSGIEEYEFEKEHWYSLKGTVCISGRVISIRNDQGGRFLHIEKQNIRRRTWKKVEKMIEEYK